ncbi:MAG: ABC transporter substrate-binding protein [Acidimicrobiales bacterium]|nr:ABC transporter substrate-binding protein [Acidimicrobiales bacterium]
MSSTTTAPPPTGEPIKLMVISEAGGPLPHNDSGEGADAAAAAINRRGGIQGRPVEILHCDSQGDPNAGRECGREAVDEGVVALVGNLSFQAGEFLPIMVENQIPSIGATPVGVADVTSEASFPLGGGVVSFGAGLSSVLADQGAEQVASVLPDVPVANIYPEFVQQGLDPFGLEVASETIVPTGAPDMATYVEDATGDGQDGVMMVLEGEDNSNFVLTAVQDASPDVLFAISVASQEPTRNLVEQLGDDSDRLFTIVNEKPWTLEDDPAVAEYRADMEAAGFDEFSDFRMRSYMAVMAVEQVAADMDVIDAPSLYEELGTVDDLDLGLMPPVDLTEGGKGGFARLFNICVAYASVEVESPVMLTGDFFDPTTGEPCT